MSFLLPFRAIRCSHLAAADKTVKQTEFLLTKVKNVLSLSQFSSNNNSLPDYNYNLPGKGKGKKRKTYTQNIKVVGEVLFGIHPILLALKRNVRACHKLYIQKSTERRPELLQQIISLCVERNISVTALHKQELDNLSGSRPHQGVCIDASYLKMEELKPESFSEICSKTIQEKSSKPLLWLLLYRVQDPMNFGAILRSAYYFGTDKVIFSKEHSSVINPVVSKSSSGALELLPMAYTNKEHTLLSLLKSLKKYNWQLVGTVGKNCQLQGKPLKPIEDVYLSDSTVLIVGNEGSGLSDELLNMCDQLVTISSHTDNNEQHEVDSLNVSVATGILLHSLKKPSQKS